MGLWGGDGRCPGSLMASCARGVIVHGVWWLRIRYLSRPAERAAARRAGGYSQGQVVGACGAPAAMPHTIPSHAHAAPHTGQMRMPSRRTCSARSRGARPSSVVTSQRVIYSSHESGGEMRPDIPSFFNNLLSSTRREFGTLVLK